MRFHASLEAAWSGLLYYEQIEDRPPWLLRLLLPVPVRTEGRKSQVGDEAVCRYETGHLKKRVTSIDPGRLYRFLVVEQDLAIRGGIRLLGGSYRFSPLPSGDTEVSLETRYTSRRRLGWPWRPVEAMICHAFHRRILKAMRRAVESKASPSAAAD